MSALVLILLLCPAWVDDPAPIPSDPVFRAFRTDGTTARGRIRQVGPEGRLLLSDDASDVAIPLASLVRLVREGEPPAATPEGSLALFPGGDRLRAQVGNSTDTAFEILPPAQMAHSPLDGPITIPIDAPLALLLIPGSDPDAQESLLLKLRDDPRRSEVLLTTNDDRIIGGFLGLGATKVGFEREGGPPEVDRARVAAIEFDPKLARYPEPEGVSLEFTFLDGSRLGAASCRVESGRIVLATRFGGTLRAPLASLAEVRVIGGAVEYLADREPAGHEFVGYLGAHRGAFGRDRTADGRRIRLGGRPYDRGLGTEPRTLLAYRLGPKDRRFQATVGLDDRAGELGSVVFRVLVNGEERLATPPMTSRDAPREVDLDLTGARVLILATEFGDGGDVQDSADWADARIIREVE